ncbi:MAG TPA: hypothetical protein DER07_07505, partial [Armatimonadetes bacterium]|nr:hypothetical protein [Armatimonadota bacterium]
MGGQAVPADLRHGPRRPRRARHDQHPALANPATCTGCLRAAFPIIGAKGPGRSRSHEGREAVARPSHQASLRTGLEVRVDPRVILSSQILQLNAVELESTIENELEENPALERLEEADDPV